MKRSVLTCIDRETPLQRGHEHLNHGAASAAGEDTNHNLFGVGTGGLLLAGARTRFVIAVLLSLALWAGYFWVTAGPSTS